MGFDIAVYNGSCLDFEKISNSIKAAYLYADRVRVYDRANIKVTGLETLSEELRYLEKDINYPEFHPCTDMKIERPIEVKALLNTFFDIVLIDDIDSCRLRFAKNRIDQDINRLGIDIVGFEYDAKDYKVIHPYDVCDYQFIKDKGYKIINDFSLHDKMSPKSSSMWAPAYLSEYAISSLPSFEEATIDEIIDIRRELNRYIVPYRSAILKMSDAIKEIPDEESIQQECMRIYLRDIEPKVVAINYEIRDNNIFKNIAKNAFTNEKIIAGIGSLINVFATGGEIAEAICAGTALVIGATSVSKGISDTLSELKRIKKNEMFFLYEAGKKVKKGKTIQ